MTRRLLNILTVLSLMLCVTASAMWWAYRNGREWWVCGKHDKQSFTIVYPCMHGEFFISVNRPYPNPPASEVEFSVIRFPGFWFRHAGGGDAGNGRLIDSQHWSGGLSYWLVVPATAVLPVARGLTRFVRRLIRRGREGYCGCGYDLTGNKSGTCPECGALVGTTA